MSKTTNKFSPEVRHRAVRMVLDHESVYPSRWLAVVSVADKNGCAPQTLHERVKRAEVDNGRRAGISTETSDKLKALERENRELRQANEILRKASACFAQGEEAQAMRGMAENRTLDRPFKRRSRLSTITVESIGSSRSAMCCRLPLRHTTSM